MAGDQVAVFDFGSLLLKAGVPYEEVPIRPSVVTASSVSSKSTNAVTRAIKNGNVCAWDAVETLVDHALYKKMGWQAGQEASVMIAEPILTSRADREHLAQLLFEHNNAASLLVCDSPVLSMFAAGKLSGCVVDLGHDKTDIAAVADGQLLPASAFRLERSLDSEALAQASQAHSQEEMAFCQLPDGQQVKLEASTRGASMEDNVEAIGHHLQDSYQAVQDIPTRKMVMEHLLVCGGGSKMPGISQNLVRQYNESMPPSTAGALVHPPDYMSESLGEFSAWLGGAVLVKAVALPHQYMSKMEYSEAGPSAIHRHCI